MNVSAIREILKVVSRRGIVSLAGGIPSPDSFPMEAMNELVSQVFDRYGTDAPQYGLKKGFAPLRDELSGLLSTSSPPAAGRQRCVSISRRPIRKISAEL
jgi:2-aminoadipate transaminase